MSNLNSNESKHEDLSYGIKHLIQCQCILPQFKNNIKNPIFHKFAVFSIVEQGVIVKEKFVQCTHCGIIHKVSDISVSEIMVGKENMSSVITLQDIRLNLPEKIVTILDTYDLDIATWENVQYIIDNERWGEHVVLSSDLQGNIRQGKILRIMGTNLLKIETFTRNEEVTRV